MISVFFSFVPQQWRSNSQDTLKMWHHGADSPWLYRASSAQHRPLRSSGWETRRLSLKITGTRGEQRVPVLKWKMSKCYCQFKFEITDTNVSIKTETKIKLKTQFVSKHKNNDTKHKYIFGASCGIIINSAFAWKFSSAFQLGLVTMRMAFTAFSTYYYPVKHFMHLLILNNLLFSTNSLTARIFEELCKNQGYRLTLLQVSHAAEPAAHHRRHRCRRRRIQVCSFYADYSYIETLFILNMDLLLTRTYKEKISSWHIFKKLIAVFRTFGFFIKWHHWFKGAM